MVMYTKKSIETPSHMRETEEVTERHSLSYEGDFPMQRFSNLSTTRYANGFSSAGKVNIDSPHKPAACASCDAAKHISDGKRTLCDRHEQLAQRGTK